MQPGYPALPIFEFFIQKIVPGVCIHLGPSQFDITSYRIPFPLPLTKSAIAEQDPNLEALLDLYLLNLAGMVYIRDRKALVEVGFL